MTGLFACASRQILTGPVQEVEQVREHFFAEQKVAQEMAGADNSVCGEVSASIE